MKKIQSIHSFLMNRVTTSVELIVFIDTCNIYIVQVLLL